MAWRTNPPAPPADPELKGWSSSPTPPAVSTKRGWKAVQVIRVVVEPGSALAQMYAPGLTVDVAVVVPRMQATAQMHAPSVDSSIIVPAFPPMLATATMHNPAVASSVAVSPEEMEAVAAMLDPAVSAGQAITAPAMQASALMLAPTVTVFAVTGVLAPTMQATAAMVAPLVTIGNPVSAPPMVAMALMPGPAISAGQSVTIPRMQATALMPTPVVRSGAGVLSPAMAAVAAMNAPSVVVENPVLVTVPPMTAEANFMSFPDQTRPVTIPARLRADIGMWHSQPFTGAEHGYLGSLDMYEHIGGLDIAIAPDGFMNPTGANTNQDRNMIHWTPTRGDNVVARFKVGTRATSTASTWFANLQIGVEDGYADFVVANFATNALFLDTIINGVTTGRANLQTSAANFAIGDWLEFSRIGTLYSAVKLTAAGVRTTICTWNDTGNLYPRDAQHRRVGMRLGRNGTNNSAGCDQFEFYDADIWPIPQGRTKSGTQAYSVANAWQAPTGWAARTGFPHTSALSGNNGVIMQGHGTVQVKVNRAWSASEVSQARVLKNGVVQHTSPSVSASASLWTSGDITVAKNDVISIEVLSTTTGTIAATTYFEVMPVAPSTQASEYYWH